MKINRHELKNNSKVEENYNMKNLKYRTKIIFPRKTTQNINY